MKKHKNIPSIVIIGLGIPMIILNITGTIDEIAHGETLLSQLHNVAIAALVAAAVTISIIRLIRKHRELIITVTANKEEKRS